MPKFNILPKSFWDKFTVQAPRLNLPQLPSISEKYINYIENADSIGWDAASRRWYAPTDPTKYDVNNFGMGIDRNTNPYIKNFIKKDSLGREYLTELDEQNIRKRSIEDVVNSWNNRKSYGQKQLKTKKEPTDIKQLAILGAIYRNGSRAFANIWERPLIDSAFFGQDSTFLDMLYSKMKYPSERINRSNEFLNANTTNKQ